MIGRSVYDALFYLRSRWFRWQSDPTSPIVEPRVYRDGAFLGQGWVTLTQVPLAGVGEIRRFDTAEALQRFGAEVGTGWAVEVRTGSVTRSRRTP